MTGKELRDKIKEEPENVNPLKLCALSLLLFAFPCAEIKDEEFDSAVDRLFEIPFKEEAE